MAFSRGVLAAALVVACGGTQHGPAPFPPRVNEGRLAGNPNAYSWFMRSLLLKLDAWVAHGVAPPPSVYPTLADGTLVPRSQLKFPKIPGVDVLE